MRIIDWSSDVCSSDLYCDPHFPRPYRPAFVVPQRPQPHQRFATNDSSRATSSGTPVPSRGGGAARQLGIEVSDRRELRGAPAADMGVRRTPAHQLPNRTGSWRETVVQYCYISGVRVTLNKK